MRWFWRGFMLNKADLYPFTKFDWRLFLSDRQVLRTSLINGDFNQFLEDKLLFDEAIKDRAPVPKVFGYKDNANLHWYDGSPQDLEELIRTEKKIIVKPIDGNGGKGIYTLESREDSLLKNERPTTMAEIESEVMQSGKVMFCKYLEQGAFANSLYSRTVNTVRMLTMLDPDDGEAFIASACLRVGRLKSFPVDNISSGGLFCTINKETGRLGKATTFRSPIRWFDKHPNTGVVFQEQCIPQWDKVCREVLELAATFPDMPHIAWDIALLDDEISIIEANGWSHGALFQVETPLLMDPKVLNFYQHHGVI